MHSLYICIYMYVCVCVCVCIIFSHIRLFWIPCTVVLEAPLSMGFSRQECWSGLPFASPSPGDRPNPGMEPGSPALQADSLLSKPSGKCVCVCVDIFSNF